MDIRIYKKPIMTKFIVINGIEFEASHLFGCLEEIRQTKEDDHYGDYSLRNYELSYPDEMDKLVKMGFVKNYTGSRMANLYCMKDEKGIEDLMTKLYELDEKDI